MSMDLMQVFSGRLIRPLALTPEDVEIGDIARSLSHLCRFAGHSRFFYSVGEHSLRASIALDSYGADIALWGLLHDASEAYLVDVPSPIKHDKRFAFYRATEKRVMRAICQRFWLDEEAPAEVGIVDKRMVVTEARDLLNGVDMDWWIGNYGEPFPAHIIPLAPPEVEAAFLDRFNALMQLRKAA